MKILPIKSLIAAPVKWHSRLLFDYLDPVKDSRSLGKKALARKFASKAKYRQRFNFNFLVPFALAMFTYTLGNFGLEYFHRGSFEWRTWLHSPYPMHHQMFPRMVWIYGMISLAISSTAAMISFISFTLNPLDDIGLYHIVGDSAIWVRGKGLSIALDL